MAEAAPPAITCNPNPTPSPPLPPPPPPPPPPPRISMKTSADTWIAIFSYILSLPVLCYGIWLLITKDYYCQDHLHVSHLREITGAGLVAVFAISCFVTYHGARVVLPGALALSVPLLVMLMFGVLLIGSYPMEGRGLPASPLWIRSRIEDDDVWINVKRCIYESRTCQDLANDASGLSADDFSAWKLSAVESGCCKPPSACEMEYVNATYWRRTEGIAATNDGTFGNSRTPAIATNPSANSSIDPGAYGDCRAYSNENTRLCYDCQSCKRGFTSAIHRRWKLHGIFMIAASAMLMLIHTPRFILTMTRRNKNEEASRGR